jgi:O-antigen ligase
MLAGLLAILWLQRRQHPMVRCASAPSTSSLRARLLVVLVGTALLALLLANSGRVLERFAEELDTVQALATGEIAYDRDSSLSFRLHAHLFGLQAWSERPWFGWGAGTTRSLMDASGELALRSLEGVVLKHLHNTYLEAAVQLGLGGLVLFLALHLGLIGLVARRFLSADDASTGDSDRDCLIFLVAALVLLLVWDLFDYRLVRQDWRGYWTLLAGAALSFGVWSGLRPSMRP